MADKLLSTIKGFAEASMVGGAFKVAQYDDQGNLAIGPLSGGSTSADANVGNLRMPVAKNIQWYKQNGAIGANQYLMDGHSGGDELFTYSPRICFYFDQGFQFGQPAGVTARAPRFVYFNPLGTATSPDPTRESVSHMFNGNIWSGSAGVTVMVGQQFVPTSTTGGEWQFWGGMTNQPITDGKLSSTPGATKNFVITNNGPVIPSGKTLTFPDGTFINTKPITQARTGNVTLALGTATIADTTVTTFTNVLLTRRSAGGTIGDLTYTTTAGVGFTINSSSPTDASRVTYCLLESLVSASAPTISGTNEVGDTLTVVSGGGGSVWQWYSNGVLISGATSSTFVIRPVDIGLPITCREGGIASNEIIAWHPDDEAGYFADYRADVGALKVGGIAAINGEAVETWQDQSGNARHVTQATVANQPLFNTTTYPGFAFIDFDVTNDTLVRASVTIPRPYTVFAVAESKTVNANKRIFSAGTAGPRIFIEQLANQNLMNFDVVGTVGQMPLNTRHIATARTTATLNTIKVDANTEVTLATGTSADGLSIHISQSAGGGGADCRVFAILIYASDLSAASQTRVRKYLKAKWGTP